MSLYRLNNTVVLRIDLRKIQDITITALALPENVEAVFVDSELRFKLEVIVLL